MIVTHVLVLKAIANLEDSPEWQDLLRALIESTRRPVYAGRQEEDSGKLWLLTEWPCSGCWSRDPIVRERIDGLTGTAKCSVGASFAVAVQSEDRAALSSPTTEISIGFVRSGSEAAIRLEQAVAIYKQKAAVSELPGKAVGTVSGWTYDKDLAFTTLDAEQSQARGYFSLLGWESRAAHYAFPESEIGIEDIMSAGAEGWQVAHVGFKKTET